MAKYAYLDYGEILHITKYEQTAKAYAKYNGKYVKTDFPAAHGYPIDKEGNYYTLYSETEERHGYAIPPELAELYKSLK